MGAEVLGGIGMTAATIGWTADPHGYIQPEGRHTRLASILAAVAAGNETQLARSNELRRCCGQPPRRPARIAA